MRDRKVEEFTSLFEQASLPVFDLPTVSFRRFSLVLTGGELDDWVVEVTKYLKQRFGVTIGVHCFGTCDEQKGQDAAKNDGFEVVATKCSTPKELAERLNEHHSQLVVLPVDAEHEFEIDPLVEGVRAPVLLLRKPSASPQELFQNILHSLPGNFRQHKENFAYSFRLVEPEGRVLLLHTIDQQEIQDIREAFEIAPTLDQQEERELINQLTRKGERYLKAVVASSRELPCEVNYKLQVGDAVSIVEEARRQTPFGLLVIGCHEEGRSHIGAEVYRLMHLVEDIAVLAL